MKTKVIAIAAICALGMHLWGQSPQHLALSKEIEGLRKLPAVCELPKYLSNEESFDDVCRSAGNKKVFVSIGREKCGRCQRFYEMVRRGKIVIDKEKYVFIRLDIDNVEQREYFFGTFEPGDNKLPFVGVTDSERSDTFPCLTGAPSAKEYQELMK